VTDNRRELFEERVFREYFIRSIKKNENVPQPRISGALDFISTAKLNKAELCERNEDDYKRPEISAMWMGWKLAWEGNRE